MSSQTNNIAVLQDVEETAHAVDVTAGYLRAGLRKVDEDTSKSGAPVLLCTTFEAVPIGEKVRYRIPLVPNSRSFRSGHKIRLFLTTDDQNKDIDVPLGLTHCTMKTASLTVVFDAIRGSSGWPCFRIPMRAT